MQAKFRVIKAKTFIHSKYAGAPPKKKINNKRQKTSRYVIFINWGISSLAQ
jgi:hypothetical protein